MASEAPVGPGDRSRAGRIARIVVAPELDDLYVIAALAVILLPTLAMSVGPNDFWFHIATARETLSAGAVPSHDLFSFTREGESYFNQPWLGQLLLYSLYRLDGLELVVFVHSLTITSAVGVLALLCRDLGASKRSSAVAILLVALPMAAPNLGVRPQAYAFLLFAIALWLVWGTRERALTDPEAGRVRIWLLPVITLAWVNLHGSFPLALALIGAALVGDGLARWLGGRRPPRRFSRRLVAVGIASALATMINPAGWQVWGYVVRLTTSSVVSDLVMEWQSPLRHAIAMPFALCVAVPCAAAVLAKRRPDVAEALIVGGLLALALSALRHTGWYGFAAAALLARLWAGHLPDRPRSRAGTQRINRAVVVLLGGVAVLCLPWVRVHTATPIAQLYAAQTPISAVAALDELEAPPKRLFSEVGYGSYLIWARPDVKVFVDPRFELYPRQLWADYNRLSAGEDIARITEAYRLDGVLGDRENQPQLIEALRADGGWDVVYEDEVSVLFVPR